MALISSRKKRKNSLDQKIADEYHRLIDKPENMKSACVQLVMKKFGIKARSTVYTTVRRVNDRNNSQQGQPDSFKFKPDKNSSSGISG